MTILLVFANIYLSEGRDMKRRELVRKLLEAGYESDGGTKHEHFRKGKVTVMVPRHREIPDQMARVILRQAGIL